MEVYLGKSVLNGIAMGKIYLYQKKEQKIQRYKVQDSAGEITRFQDAKAEASRQLRSLYEKALKEVGEANAAIFEVHQMMLEDDDYVESVENIITGQNVNAEYAVAATGDNFAAMFSAMDDEYMKERAADVKDISERILAALHGGKRSGMTMEEPMIVVAADLAPSETVQLEKDKVLAFVTVRGSTNSHTAILARTMGIPALIGTELPLSDSLDGVFAIVDGSTGSFYVNPTEEVTASYREKKQKELEQKEMLAALKGKENITKDGRHIMVYANIGNSKDLAMVIKNDAGGIGLFRSEFLYLEASDYPTEEEQFHVYKTVAETMAGKRVIVRTLDIGADKQVDYFNMEHEENPALGCRAIRICLTRKEIFKTQLRALFRASAYGRISIMYPMITSVEEVRQIYEIVEEVKEEMKDEEIDFSSVEQGIMIETPAAVMVSDKLAQMVDFFSIGTNDLTQYTLAIDRQNEKLDDFYHPHHLAVLRMIKMTADNAHKHGKWCGICGELGADPALTKLFLAMGIDELSVSPSCVLPLRKTILETDVEAERDELLKRLE